MTTVTTTAPAIDSIQIDFAKMGGLVPGMVQDAATGELLMLGFLNEGELEAKNRSRSGYVTFWSRSRRKALAQRRNQRQSPQASSPPPLTATATLCCFSVVVEGDGVVCHEGTVSCFTKPIAVGKG